MTVASVMAMTLFAWIAWRKARSGQQDSWLQREEARLKDRTLAVRSESPTDG